MQIGFDYDKFKKIRLKDLIRFMETINLKGSESYLKGVGDGTVRLMIKMKKKTKSKKVYKQGGCDRCQIKEQENK